MRQSPVPRNYWARLQSGDYCGSTRTTASQKGRGPKQETMAKLGKGEGQGGPKCVEADKTKTAENRVHCCPPTFTSRPSSARTHCYFVILPQQRTSKTEALVATTAPRIRSDHVLPTLDCPRYSSPSLIPHAVHVYGPDAGPGVLSQIS